MDARRSTSPRRTRTSSTATPPSSIRVTGRLVRSGTPMATARLARNIVSPDTETDRDCLVFTSRDVSDRPRFEARFLQFVTHTSDVLTVFDEQGNVEYISPSVERVLGYEQTSCRTQTSLRTASGRSLERPHRVRPDVTNRGTRRHEHRTATQMATGSGRSPAASKSRRPAGSPRRRDDPRYLRTVTARAELDRQNPRLDDFARVLARHPRPAGGRTGPARTRTRTRRRQPSRPRRARPPTHHDVVEDVLSLARDSASVLARRDNRPQRPFTAGLGDHRHADATLQTDLTATVVADRSRLQQLIENLVRNSIEHGGDGVVVTVGDRLVGILRHGRRGGLRSDGTADLFKPGHSTADAAGFGL